MARPIEVKISMVGGVPTPSIDPIDVPKGSGAAKIEWTIAEDEKSIEFLRVSFKDSHQSECSDPHPKVVGHGHATKTVNQNSEQCEIDYTIDVLLNGGGTATNDPKIRNGGGDSG